MSGPRRNRFVGREVERAALRGLLQHAPQVTLVGTGGVGKTRLAVEVAADLARQGMRTYFCGLESAVGVDDVCRVVARSLELTSLGSDAIGRIRAALSARPRHLLVLDNFEHLTDLSVELVAAWTGADPSGRILVTSRDRLGLPDEVVSTLEPLSTPPRGDEAIELLLSRVAEDRRFDHHVLEQIVQELDGLPLAIELAAARLSVLTEAELLRLLPRRLDVLTRAPRGTVARHQTLRASIEWSFRMLSPEERVCLAHCALFRGAFGLDAMAAVLAVDPVFVLDGLQALRDRSLLRVEATDTGTRYSVLSSIRAFADEALDGATRALARARFADHYLGVARALGEACALRGTAGPSEPQRALLLAELENLEGAARILLEATPARVGEALELLTVVGLGVAIDGPFATYLGLLDGALERESFATLPRRALVEALSTRARIRRLSGSRGPALADALTAVELADAVEMPIPAGRAWAILGLLHADGGRYLEAREAYARAMALLTTGSVAEAALLVELGDVERLSGHTGESASMAERALRMFRAAEDPRGIGRAANLLAIARTNEARHVEAQTAYLEAIALFGELGDRRLEAMARGNLAMLLQDRQQFAEAGTHYERAILVLKELGDVATWASYVALSGTLLHEMGRIGEATTRYEDALDAFRRLGQPRSIALGLGHLGAALAGSGQLARARTSLDEADTILAGVDDRLGRAAVEVHRAHLDLASGDHAALESRRAAAQTLHGDSQQVRRALRLLERVAPTALNPAALVVEPEGAWFRVPGQATEDLSRRTNQRRLLVALAAARTERPGIPVEAAELVRLGWPGERMRPEAGRLRLRVAIAALRKLGLHAVLRSDRKGWWLDTSIELVVAPSSAPPPR